jgi:hypothetical protein
VLKIETTMTRDAITVLTRKDGKELAIPKVNVSLRNEKKRKQ